MEAALYCKTYGETICWEYGIKGGKHYSHEYDKLDVAYRRYKEEIMSILEPMETHLLTIKEASEQLEIRCSEISDQEAAIETDIKKDSQSFARN